jgi:hypothetical protein
VQPSAENPALPDPILLELRAIRQELSLLRQELAAERHDASAAETASPPASR